MVRATAPFTMRLFPLICLTLTLASSALRGEVVSLFNGKDLEGWDYNAALWKVAAGEIIGGSATEKIAHNDFLATKKSYSNFDLRVKLRLTGTGFVNSGIQIRSVRVPGSSEMSGYQVDYGAGWYGKLYDESRRNKVIAESVDMKAATAAIKADDWNEYRILAEGSRIQTWINGVPALDYVETDAKIAQDGYIGIQIHSGGPALVQAKDIFIEELPPTPNAPTWDKLKTAASAPTPEEQLTSFKVPEGFTVELVAQESDGIGKFITVVWDHSGRMWSMTALDYPVDANENQALAEALYDKGGRDKIVVFDQPFGPGPQQPRIYADGLAIPLGILPWKDGVYAQYGHDIRLYRDTDGDGKADEHDVILTGFGIDDSHLFPHQFTPAPGGWIYLAQGAFNHGEVRRPDGKPFATGSLFSTTPQASTKFSFCKLARMRPDGSDFQLVSSGPNNIWGLVLDKTGEVFAQEANDLGYPVFPFRNGTHVPGVGQDKLKPYAPILPTSFSKSVMGGTGLSGLALKEDQDWPVEFTGTPEGRVFYLANPITSMVQRVKVSAKGDGYAFEKQDDFMTSSNSWFRPIAIHFGPDGCLYVVDWCNKIISHNEVPRVHPDRDKTRGRIWRIRHKDQPAPQVPDLAKMSSDDLLLYLESPSQWAQRTAMQELVWRGESRLMPTLKALSCDENKPTDTRIHALWVWEQTGLADIVPITMLLKDANRNIRREAARALTTFAKELGSGVVAASLAPLVADPDAQVRTAAVQTLSSIAEADVTVLELLVKFVSSPVGTSDYDKAFQRYLVRAALEEHPVELAALLDSPAASAMAPENAIFAALALPRDKALVRFVKAFHKLNRVPDDEEVITLLTPPLTSKNPSVAEKTPWELAPPGLLDGIAELILSPSKLVPTLEAAVRHKNRLNHAYAAYVLGKPILQYAASQADKATPSPLIVQLAAAFPRRELADPVLRAALSADSDMATRLLAVEALPALSPADAGRLVPLAADENTAPALRVAALAALASVSHAQSTSLFTAIWPNLNALERSGLTGKLISAKPGAQVLLDAVAQGSVKDADLDASLLERLNTLFPEQPAMKALWTKVSKSMVRVLKLNGAKDSYVDSNIDLAGAFTAECWVRMDEGMGNEDGILSNGKNLDLNFFARKLRVYAGSPPSDVAIAAKEMTAGAWTHVAVTRDEAGIFRIYLNGELDVTSRKAVPETLAGCDIGRTSPAGKGTAGEFTEYRIWNVCRSAEEIRANIDRSFAGESSPTSLTNYYSPLSDWPQRKPLAQVVPVLEGPHLLSAGDSEAQAAKLAKYKAIATKTGDAKSGEMIFTSLCLSCHTLGGKGGNLAPALDGSAHRELDGMLRALLTPNAAVEGGYRAFRVETRDGRQLEGFLVMRDKDGITLRMMGGAEQRVSMNDVAKADFTSRSLMIEGLLDALPEEQVVNLFSYIRTLK